LPKLKILVEAEGENGNTWERIVKKGFDTVFNCSDEDSSDDEEENEESEDNEENGDIEENEEEINIENNDIIFEEIFQFNTIDDNQTFQR